MKNIRTVLIGLAIAGVCATWFVQRATAFKEVDATLHSGLFGLTSSQTVRLSVSNLLATTRLETCDFQYTFYDPQGVMVRQGRELLLAGQSGYWDVDFQDVSTQRDTLGRKSLRVEIVGFHTSAAPGCLASLEIVNKRSGITELLIGDPNQIPPRLTQ